MSVDNLYYYRIDIYIIFFWVKWFAGLCTFKQEILSFKNHYYYVSAINKLLVAENLKSWGRGKMVQNEGLNIAFIQWDSVLIFFQFFVLFVYVYQLMKWRDDENPSQKIADCFTHIQKFKKWLFWKTSLWK